MTDAELDALDRLCATRIMGWELEATPYPNDHRNFWNKGSGVLDTPEGCWQPTRNIAQAWECLEKSGYPYVIDSYPAKPDLAPRCILLLIDRDVEARAETAPLAIVMAVLKAKGIEV